MSLLMLDGGDDNLRNSKWSNVIGTWTTEASRTGNGWRKTSGGGLLTMRRNLLGSEEHATLTAGFIIRIADFAATANPQRGTVAAWKSDSGATEHVTVGLDDVGRFQVFRGQFGTGTLLGETDPNTIQIDVFHYVEIRVQLSDTVGVVRVHVDGVQLINENNIDTKNGGTKTVFDAWEFQADQTYQIDANFDDFYLTNGAGAAPYNGRLGDIVIETLLPDGNGATSDWVGSDADSVDNYLHVDEATPDDDTSYVESVADADVDLYTFDDLVVTSGVIRGVVATAHAKHIGGGDNARLLTRISAANHAGADVAIPASYASFSEIWQVSPSSGIDWTIAEVNAAEWGIEDRA